MAFQTATGYGNLPNGNFSPVIYSKQVQLAFRKSTVVGDITNSDYFGEIANQGDTVIFKNRFYGCSTTFTINPIELAASGYNKRSSEHINLYNKKQKLINSIS